MQWFHGLKERARAVCCEQNTANCSRGAASGRRPGCLVGHGEPPFLKSSLRLHTDAAISRKILSPYSCRFRVSFPYRLRRYWIPPREKKTRGGQREKCVRLAGTTARNRQTNARVHAQSRAASRHSSHIARVRARYARFAWGGLNSIFSGGAVRAVAKTGLPGVALRAKKGEGPPSLSKKVAR